VVGQKQRLQCGRKLPHFKFFSSDSIELLKSSSLQDPLKVLKKQKKKSGGDRLNISTIKSISIISEMGIYFS
jgi:hypothetical protein